MLYREIMAVCSEIHTKQINTVSGQNVELLNVKLVVHIVTTAQYILQLLPVTERLGVVVPYNTVHRVLTVTSDSTVPRVLYFGGGVETLFRF